MVLVSCDTHSYQQCLPYINGTPAAGAYGPPGVVQANVVQGSAMQVPVVAQAQTQLVQPQAAKVV